MKRTYTLLCTFSLGLACGGDDDIGGSDPTTGAGTETGQTESDDGIADGSTDTGDTGDETGEHVSFTEEVWPVIQSNCSCHLSAPFPENLNLSEADAYGSLVGATASQPNPAMNRIESGAAEDSYLWHKLNDTHAQAGGSGVRMPPGRAALGQADLDLIAKWIDDGAAP